jgi:hypothetical protein
MQRPTAAKAGLMGAFSIALTLPLSVTADAATLSHASSRIPVASATDASVPQRWRNYALASITPTFSWAPAVAKAPPQITDAQGSLASFAVTLQSLGEQPIGSLNLSVAHSVVDSRVQSLASPQLDVRSELDDIGLKRTVVAPSYTGRWGKQGSLGVTAVLAYQRFASLGLGESTLGDETPMWPVVPGETSYGAGLRLDIGNTLLNRLSWSAAYQSRVNMDALNSLRGVYTDPGQFDIPASASVGVSYALTPSLTFDVGAQRVMYSEVTPFTSPALPRRFLALLGSGASPVFAWQDLTVYSAGWTFRDDAFGNLELRYTTRQQPSPTSTLLSNALDSSPADHTVAVGYSRSTGQQATLSLQAIYSSAPYFLGVPSYRSTDRVTGNQVEYEAAWSWRF